MEEAELSVTKTWNRYRLTGSTRLANSPVRHYRRQGAV